MQAAKCPQEKRLGPSPCRWRQLYKNSAWVRVNTPSKIRLLLPNKLSVGNLINLINAVWPCLLPGFRCNGCRDIGCSAKSDNKLRLLVLAGCQSFGDIENPLTKLVVSVGNLVSAEVDGSVGIKPVEDEVASQVLGVLPAVGQILYVQHIGRGMLIVQSIDVTGICPVVEANPAEIEIV